MVAIVNRLGQTFGKLTVVAMAPERNHGSVVWICDCACGTKGHRVRASHLSTQKGCGCLQGKARPSLKGVPLTQARLKQLLDYNSETGEFFRKVGVSNIRAGACAGKIDSYGYWKISIDDKQYRGHHLAWLHVHGSWPKT